MKTNSSKIKKEIKNKDVENKIYQTYESRMEAKHSFKSKIKRYFLGSLFLVGLFVCIQTVNAQGTLGDWDKYLFDLPTFAPSTQTGEQLAIDFVLNFVTIVRSLVGILALIMGALYGIRLVMSRGQEEAITKQRKNFLWVLFGFAVLIVSENVARVLNPEQATAAALIDFGAARDQLRDIIDYLKWLLGSVIVLFMIFTGIRMVTASGDEEVIKKQKDSLVWAILGMMTILLADNIVNAVYVLNAPDEAVGASPTTAISEIASIIRLILVFLGPIAIIYTIVAGFSYLGALDNEDQAKKARSRIVAGIIAIVMIYGAYAFVNSFTSVDLTWINLPLA